MTYIVLIAWAIAFAWLLGAALTLAALARLKFLKPTDDSRLKTEDAPHVSILLPARNEERRVLADCVRSLLAQDYGSFEVVAVDDRSTDATLPLLRSLAEEDARLRVIAGGELPDGWLGKPNALRQALETARGSWVLTTDADVIFHPSALRTALTYARSHDCDAVSLFPHFETRTFWERVFTPTWVWGLLVFFPLDLVNRRRGVRLAIGMGAFVLMRREALAAIGDFASVRADVIEDVRLAEKLKRSGAYLRVEFAPDLIRTRMYSNLRELWEGSTKNLFAALKFSYALTLAYLVWTFSVAVGPTILLGLSATLITAGVEGPWRELLVPSSLALALHVALLALVCVRFRVPPAYALAGPLGFALACAVMLTSAVAVTTGRGVTWKGRKIYERAGGLRPPRA
ncbi:MAG TPA: glycosyltransferase family 2 protein [Pyrinomonadaceae bacterium]